MRFLILLQNVSNFGLKSLLVESLLIKAYKA